MNTPFDTRPSSGTNTTLWVAVGVLGLAVLGMGATLIRMQTKSAEAPSAAVSSPATVATPASVLSLAGAGSAPAATTEVITETADKNTSNKAVGHTNQAQVATKNTAKTNTTASPSHQAVPSPTSESVVTHAPAKPLCTNCGTVESVTPVERDGEGSGVGVVAGGVLGAVVGNQVGGGSGKTLATVLGAVGGGMAGNAVEKKMKKVTHYRVTVRMDDGSTRTVDQSTPPAVGAQVNVNGNTLSNASR